MVKIHIYHHNDRDGKGAAVAAILYLTNESTYHVDMDDIEVYSIDYKMKLNFDHIENEDMIYFLDYSFSNKDNIKELKLLCKRNKNVVWLDHHASSIDVFNKDKDYWEENMRFSCIANKISGAALTWLFFNRIEDILRVNSNHIINLEDISEYTMKDIPLIIKYIDDYDCFKNKMLCTREFIYGLDSYDWSHNVKHPNWGELIVTPGGVSNSFIETTIKKGVTIREYLDMMDQIAVKEIGFEFKINGHSVYAVNRSGNSFMFGELFNTYDIVCTFNYDGDLFEYSFYTSRDNINVGEIATMLGGGGHPKASGFQNEKLLFQKGVEYNISNGATIKEI